VSTRILKGDALAIAKLVGWPGTAIAISTLLGPSERGRILLTWCRYNHADSYVREVLALAEQYNNV